jgi:hydrogenase expression/formation protein HypC
MCLGIPGQIVEIRETATPPSAIVLLDGTHRMVDLTLVADEGVAPGNWVLVHAGLALSTLDEREAHETLALLQQMSEAYLGPPG